MADQHIEGHGNQQAGGDINNYYASQQDVSRRLPSLLAHVVPVLSRQAVPEHDIALPYEISSKIEYNNVRICRGWIDEYGSYGPVVDSIYDHLDAAQPSAKRRILQQFKARYLDAKTFFLREAPPEAVEVDVIRRVADDILLRVYDRVRLEIAESGLDAVAPPAITQQDVEHCAMVLVCHAFISCKILERPRHHDSR